MFAIGSMIAAGESQSDAAISLRYNKTLNIWETLNHGLGGPADKLALASGNMCTSAGVLNTVSVNKNEPNTPLVANLVYSNTNYSSFIITDSTNSRIFALETFDNSIHVYRDTSGDGSWSSHTLEHTFSIGNNLDGLAITPDGSALITGGDTTGLYHATRSGTTWSTTTVPYSGAAFSEIIAANYMTSDRVVSCGIDDVIRVFRDDGGHPWTVEHTIASGGIAGNSLSVNDDCSEVVWTDGTTIQSITRSGTTWSTSALSIDTSTNTFHAAIMSPDGTMIACNEDDKFTIYEKSGTWSMTHQAPWTTYTGSLASAALVWSAESDSLVIIPENPSGDPADAILNISKGRVV